MSEQTAITYYGTRDEVKELSERIQKMMPGGSHYTPAEALTLAQIGIAHDLDPFNGEVWLIKDDNSGKVYGALIGIKGHRKHAKKQANYWGEFNRIVRPDDLAKYGADPNDIVFEYIIRDDVSIEAYSKSLGSLMKHGLPLEAAQKMLGVVPFTIGIGIFKHGEKTKMKPVQAAMFRAEKDALKRRFDVKFRVEVNGTPMIVSTNGDEDEPNVDEIEAEYTEMVDEPRDQDEILEELGFGGNSDDKTIFEQVVEAGLAENVYSAKNALTNHCKTGFATPEQAISWMRKYRAAKDEGKNTIEAAKIANGQPGEGHQAGVGE